MEKLKEETKDFARSEEDVLSYALFSQVAEKFLRGTQRRRRKSHRCPAPKADEARVLYVQDRA